MESKDYEEMMHTDLGKAYISAYMNDNSNYLEHYGVKGMKWGVRRTAAQLGRITARGARQVGNILSRSAKKVGNKIKDKYAERKEYNRVKKLMSKPIRKLSESEYKERMERLNKEKNMLDLQRSTSNLNQKAASAGKMFMDKVMVPAVVDAGKSQITKFLNDKFGKALGVNEKDTTLIKDVLSGKRNINDLTDKEISTLGKGSESIGNFNKNVLGKNTDQNDSDDNSAGMEILKTLKSGSKTVYDYNTKDVDSASKTADKISNINKILGLNNQDNQSSSSKAKTGNDGKTEQSTNANSNDNKKKKKPTIANETVPSNSDPRVKKGQDILENQIDWMKDWDV